MIILRKTKNNNSIINNKANKNGKRKVKPGKATSTSIKVLTKITGNRTRIIKS